MKTTLSMAKASRIPEDALNIAPTDSRFIQYLNEATDRLLKRGLYWGSYGRYSVAVSSQLMTLPPQIETIEKVAVSKQILPLHDVFFEFLENSWQIREDNLPNGSGVTEVLYRGNYPTFVDVASPGGVLTLKCDVAADAGKSVLVLGYDTATPPNWVRTFVAGAWQDGETVLLAQGAGTNTVTQFSQVTGIQPPTNLSGQWWLYQGTNLLSNYQWWETSPSYKRYLIPFINSTITTVDLIGKRAFVPVQNDSDYLIIGNLAALKLACMACKAEAEHSWSEASLLWNGGADPKTGQNVTGAIQELDFELQHQLGTGRQLGITFVGSGYGDMVEPLF